MRAKLLVVGIGSLLLMAFLAIAARAETAVPATTARSGTAMMPAFNGVTNGTALLGVQAMDPAFIPVQYRRCPRVWRPGHYNRFGRWVPGHWRHGRWIAGHHGPRGRWIPGHCM